MVNIIEFREDLKTGMGLEECLQKHDTNLKEVLGSQPSLRGRKKRKKTPKKKSVAKNIQERDGKFYLRKYINGKTRMFGTYKSLEDAKLVRGYLREHGWKQKSVDGICEKLGVERVKHQRNTVRYH